MNDLIDRYKAIRGILSMDVCVIYDDMCSTEEAVERAIMATKRNAILGLECMHSAETECTCCEYRVGDLCCYSDVKTDMKAMEEGDSN